jgi:hypothetical protein
MAGRSVPERGRLVTYPVRRDEARVPLGCTALEKLFPWLAKVAIQMRPADAKIDGSQRGSRHT